MSNNNGYVRGEDLPEREKDVEIDDRKYLIRRLTYDQVIELRGAMVDVSQMAVDEKKGKGPPKEPDAKTIAAMRRLLVAGLLEPKLDADPKKGATPDDLPIEDFFVLAAAVMNLAGARRETGERVLP